MILLTLLAVELLYTIQLTDDAVVDGWFTFQLTDNAVEGLSDADAKQRKRADLFFAFAISEN